jgi:hypothetical protein
LWLVEVAQPGSSAAMNAIPKAPKTRRSVDLISIELAYTNISQPPGYQPGMYTTRSSTSNRPANWPKAA